MTNPLVTRSVTISRLAKQHPKVNIKTSARKAVIPSSDASSSSSDTSDSSDSSSEEEQQVSQAPQTPLTQDNESSSSSSASSSSSSSEDEDEVTPAAKATILLKSVYSKAEAELSDSSFEDIGFTRIPHDGEDPKDMDAYPGDAYQRVPEFDKVWHERQAKLGNPKIRATAEQFRSAFNIPHRSASAGSPSGDAKNGGKGVSAVQYIKEADQFLKNSEGEMLTTKKDWDGDVMMETTKKQMITPHIVNSSKLVEIHYLSDAKLSHANKKRKLAMDEQTEVDMMMENMKKDDASGVPKKKEEYGFSPHAIPLPILTPYNSPSYAKPKIFRLRLTMGKENNSSSPSKSLIKDKVGTEKKCEKKKRDYDLFRNLNSPSFFKPPPSSLVPTEKELGKERQKHILQGTGIFTKWDGIKD